MSLLVGDTLEQTEMLVQDYKLTDGIAAIILDDTERWAKMYPDLKFDEKKLHGVITSLLLC